MSDPDRTLTRPPYVARYTPGQAEPERLMPAPTAQPSPELLLQHLIALRTVADRTHAYARASRMYAAWALVLSLIAAVTASYTAYVVYTILDAIHRTGTGIR